MKDTGITFPLNKNGNKPAPFSGAQPGGDKVVLNDKNQSVDDEGTWHYEINIVDTTNNKTCKLDPTVINDDGSTVYY